MTPQQVQLLDALSKSVNQAYAYAIALRAHPLAQRLAAIGAEVDAVRPAAPLWPGNPTDDELALSEQLRALEVELAND